MLFRAEFYALRALFSLLQALPPAASRRLSRLVVRALIGMIPRRRRLMASQIEACFPDHSPAQRQAIAAASLNHLADGAAGFARIPKMTPAQFDTRVETEGFEHLENALRRGRGVVIFTAHYGFWELMSVYVGHRYARVSALYRPFKNFLLNDMIAAVRRSGGGDVIDSKRVFKEGLRWLRNNGILGILADQNFYKGGAFVEFFGRAAATNTLVPLLARRTGAAVVPMHSLWKGDKVRIICEPPLRLSENPDSAQAIVEDTQAMTRVIERWIRECPEQWLWLHDRWKRRPKPDEAVHAGLR